VVIRPPRRFALVLHTHLPWVLHHGRWPHGADWLSEAVAGSYLPLLRVFTRRAREGRPLGVTLGLSPVLCEQLAHPDFADEFRFWVENRLEAASDDHERFEAEGRDDQTLLARRWERFYRGTLEDFFGPHGTNLVARFRRLEESGAIEIITCAATHGYLPLLGTPGAVERQIAVACRTHRRHFGRDPRGIWLPECAYRPPGPWVSPLGARWNESWRAGVDEVLAKHGLEFFFVDAHLVADGAPLGISSPGEWRYEHENAPSEERGPMPRGAFAVEPSGIACFARDVPTASQVWSREGGYPGDPDYLDFHKRHHASGLRYWAVTDPRGDLAGKRLYRPTAAHARARVHARHLLELVAGSSADDGDRGDGTTCAMYDTELFGHWWFEGPEFLGRVFDGAAGEGVRFESAGAALDRGGASDRRTLREGSWGEGGAHQVWLNPQTRGVWSAVHAVERRFERAAARLGAGAAGPLAERAMRQAAREVLLLEASDWPFLITNGSARDYARDRVRGHAADALRLVELALRWATGAPPTDREVERLAVCEARDSLFADLDWRPD
jgi:1,4-alpha-glucan branching enzyme